MHTATRLTASAIALFGAVTIAGAQPAQAPDPHHPAERGTGQMQHPGMQPGKGPMADGAAQAGGMGMGPGGVKGGQPMMMGGDMAGMMAMMRMMHGHTMAMDMGPAGMGMGGLQHVEGRIAFFKAELAITDAQAPRWNAFADAVRDQASRMRQAAAPATPGTNSVSAPEQMERRIAMLVAQTEALQAITAVTTALYAVLTDEQKKTADALMAEHFMAMRGRG